MRASDGERCQLLAAVAFFSSWDLTRNHKRENRIARVTRYSLRPVRAPHERLQRLPGGRVP
jgi:hypothetical protein